MGGTGSTYVKICQNIYARTGVVDFLQIGLLQLPRSSQGSRYVVVCVDRFVILAPLLNKSSAMVRHTLITHLLCPYTTPVFFSDNGLEKKYSENICNQYYIKKTFITAHYSAEQRCRTYQQKNLRTGHFQESWQEC